MKMNSENHDQEAFRKVGFALNAANNDNQYEHCAVLAEVGGFVFSWVSLRTMQTHRKKTPPQTAIESLLLIAEASIVLR